MATHQEVMSRLEGQDAVIAKSGGTAPDDHVTMSQRHAARRVGSAQFPEQKDRRQSEGDGHDRGREITLVLVLMQRQARLGLVPVMRHASGAKPRKPARAAAWAARSSNTSGMVGQRRPLCGS